MIDLSGKNLTKLTPSDLSLFASSSNSSENQTADKNDVPPTEAGSELDVSRNCLSRLDNLGTIEHLKKIDASHNLLCRLSCFGPIRNHLEHLALEDNKIRLLDGLNSLTKLRWLNLARNLIERVPLLDKLTLLRHVDLSQNLLSSLPNLSCLENLKTLILTKNQLESLDLAPKYLPNSITIFKIEGNKIRDLSQMSYLSCLTELESLSVSGNPCVECLKPAFDFRPYIICCCPQLKVIDGFVVTETEQLNGEWLYSQGKGRQFLPGNHSSLCSYLASVCPLTEGSRLSTEFEDRIQRVLEKRREHTKDASQMEFHSSSRISEVSFSLDNKENSGSDFVDLTARTDQTETKIGESKEEGKQNPYEAYDNRVPVAASKSPFLLQNFFGSPSPRSLRSPYKHKRSSPRRLFGRTPPVKERSEERKIQQTRRYPHQVETDVSADVSKEKRKLFRPEYSEKELCAAVKIESWWRGVRLRKDPATQKMYQEIRARRMEEWILANRINSEELEKQLTRTEERNSALSALTEELKKEMEEGRTLRDAMAGERTRLQEDLRNLRERCGKLEEVVSGMIPYPTDVEFQWNQEDGGMLTWKLSQPRIISGEFEVSKSRMLLVLKFDPRRRAVSVQLDLCRVLCPTGKMIRQRKELGLSSSLPWRKTEQ